MKRKSIKMLALCIAAISTIAIVGCSQADKVSQNLSKEADNFNVVRQLTVINCIQGDVLFQMEGKLSIEVDTEEDQLEVTVEDENGKYQKHFIGLSDNVTYVVEQKNYQDVSNYKYTLNFNPKMWLGSPVEVENID